MQDETNEPYRNFGAHKRSTGTSASWQTSREALLKRSWIDTIGMV